MHAPTRARKRPQRLLSVGLRADGKEEEAGDFGRRAEGQERGSSSPVAENLMTKIVLSASRDIPRRSMPEDREARYLGLVHGYDRKPKRRLVDVLKSQG